MVQRYQQGRAKVHIAAGAMGVSRKWHTRIGRFEAEGEAGPERSSRLHTVPTRTLHALENQIDFWRRRHRCGPEEIAIKLGGVHPHRVTGAGAPGASLYLWDCDPMTGVAIRHRRATAVRYERDRPG